MGKKAEITQLQVPETSGRDLTLRQCQVLVSVQIVSLHFLTLFSHWHSLQCANSFCSGPFFTMYTKIHDLALLLSYVAFQKVIHCSCNDCCVFLSFGYCYSMGLPWLCAQFSWKRGWGGGWAVTLSIPFRKLRGLLWSKNSLQPKVTKPMGGGGVPSLHLLPKGLLSKPFSLHNTWSFLTMDTGVVEILIWARPRWVFSS